MDHIENGGFDLRMDSLIDYLEDMELFKLEIDIPLVITKLVEELDTLKKANYKTYLDNILLHIPRDQFPEFLDALIAVREPEGASQKILLYLLTHQRPLYQEKGLEMIEKKKETVYLPLVIEKIYSHHQPLQKKAIQVLFSLKGNVEEILEQQLKTRSPRKLEITKRLLRTINPDNEKLALKSLDDEDFLVRIRSIEVLGNSGQRRYISVLEPLLNDPDMSVRRSAVEAIARLGGKKAKDTLSLYLESETHPPLRNIIEGELKNLK